VAWFDILYPKVPRDFPPDLILEPNKTYRVKFLEKTPRRVRGGFGRITYVIVVEYEGERRSFYVGSHVDLARQISNIELDRGNLMDLVLDIKQNPKTGRNYIFDIKIISTE